MEELIVIEGKETLRCHNVEELVKGLISDQYYDMTEEEKKSLLEKKAVINIANKNIPIIKYNKNMESIDYNAFILYDEITHILSLAKINKIVLLEKNGVNIFGKFINSKNIKTNYILINIFIDEILKKYLETKKETK